MTQVSRKTAMEMQEGKAAEFTVIFALDYYRQLYRAQMSLMLGGMPYSKIVMDNALENIMRIAIDDEVHQRYGTLAEEVAAESATITEWLEPTDAQLREIERLLEYLTMDGYVCPDCHYVAPEHSDGCEIAAFLAAKE